MANYQLPPLEIRSYLARNENGRYPFTLAPLTLWRQTITWEDLRTNAALVTVSGVVGGIEDGTYTVRVRDQNDVQLAQVEIVVGGGVPVDEAALAAAIVAALEGEAALDDVLLSSDSDNDEFTLVFVAGTYCDMRAEPTPGTIDLDHTVTVDLAALRPNNAFPRFMVREQDPYVRVLEAFPSGATLWVDDDSAVGTDVMQGVALDAIGAVPGGTTTLGATANVEPGWLPSVQFSLGATSIPSTGSVEVVVPFAPLLTPTRL